MRVLLAALTTFFLIILTNLASAKAAEAPTCSFASEGMYGSSWVKHRIVKDNQVLFGANDTESIFSQIEVLRAQGLCR